MELFKIIKKKREKLKYSEYSLEVTLSSIVLKQLLSSKLSLVLQQYRTSHLPQQR
jgi:hypothetical protein